MSTMTSFANLEKPAYGDDVDIAVINGNADIIDGLLKGLDDTDENQEDRIAYLESDNLDTIAGRSLAIVFADEIAGYANIWAWLKARVQAANFTGLRIRDYIDVVTTKYGTVRYQIGAFDPYYQCSNSPLSHHVIMVPTAPVELNASTTYVTNGSYIMWNTTATNQGTSAEKSPYLVSNLHKWEINDYLPSLPQMVRNAILPYRSLAETRYSASGALNASNGWEWKNLGEIWSPSEMEVYGCCVWGTPGYSVGMDCQFPIFKQTKDRIQGQRVFWWLRSAFGASASIVCYVNSHGYASNSLATSTWVRPLPCFLVG